MLIGLLAATVSAVMFGTAAVVQAVAVRALPRGTHWRAVLRAVLGSRALLAVLAAYLLGWVFHLVSIALLPLFLAQAGIAASLVLTAVGASWWLGERLTRTQWTCIFVTVAGLAMLTVAAGRSGTRDFRPLTAGSVVAGTLVIGVIGWWAVRSHRPPVLLGLLAGLSYAGSSVATRALADPGWDVATALAASMIPVYGLLGFWLYSVAMQRTSVTFATTPLVIAETVLPAIVGLVWLGDQIRPGLTWFVVCGLVLSVAGAVAVEQPVEPPERVSP